MKEAINLAPPGFLRVMIYVTSPTFVNASKGVLPELPPDRKSSLVETELLESTTTTTTATATATANPTQGPSYPPSPTRSQHVQIPKKQEELVLPLLPGRPNLKKILETEVEATDYSDYVAVGTCGPCAMTQTLAAAVSDAIELAKVLRGEHRRNIVSPLFGVGSKRCPDSITLLRF